MGADSDLTDEQRPHCYKAWSEYQDISEQDVDNRCPDIGDFRVGFIAGWDARGNATEQQIDERGGGCEWNDPSERQEEAE